MHFPQVTLSEEVLFLGFFLCDRRNKPFDSQCCLSTRNNGKESKWRLVHNSWVRTHSNVMSKVVKIILIRCGILVVIEIWYSVLQEQLLLSVLPVHLAFELKNKMLDKLRMGMGGTMGDINQRRSAYGKFYDLYIKVHENVRYGQPDWCNVYLQTVLLWQCLHLYLPNPFSKDVVV